MKWESENSHNQSYSVLKNHINPQKCFLYTWLSFSAMTQRMKARETNRIKPSLSFGSRLIRALVEPDCIQIALIKLLRLNASEFLPTHQEIWISRDMIWTCSSDESLLMSLINPKSIPNHMSFTATERRTSRIPKMVPVYMDISFSNSFTRGGECVTLEVLSFFLS